MRGVTSLAALAALAIFATADAASSFTLSVDGLGRVKIGMTVRQVEKAVGQSLAVDYPEDESCGEGVVRGGPDGVAYMFVDHHLARIDIDVPDKGQSPDIKTEAGVGLGASMADVQRAYGPRLSIEPDPYDENEHYLVIKGLRRGREIIFDTAMGRVDGFRAGLSKPVEYIEGCL